PAGAGPGQPGEARVFVDDRPQVHAGPGGPVPLQGPRRAVEEVRPPLAAWKRTPEMSAMQRIRFVMVGGFLGAGKTTTLARLARFYMARGQRVGIVTNDQ